MRLHAPLILELRPDIQHTCLQPWAEVSERLRRKLIQIQSADLFDTQTKHYLFSN